MPSVKLKLLGAPGGLVTYGSLWHMPRFAGDEPVRPNLTIRPGPGTPLNLPSGSYKYYFTFTGQDSDEEFEIQMRHATSPAPPPTKKKVKTKPISHRAFRFVV